MTPLLTEASGGTIAGVRPSWSSAVGVSSAFSSAAAIRRRRRIGDSMDVLTIQSCRAVRLSMRERRSTSEASAERPQVVVGRVCAVSRRPAKRVGPVASPYAFGLRGCHEYRTESSTVSGVS